MRIAALADLHLGFRAFAATVNGRNLREVDVERAWATAVDQVVEADVDLVTIAGDIFHHPRVSDHAKKAFLDGIRRFAEADMKVVILQGNHDAGKTADVLTPVMLAEGWSNNVHVVTTPKRIPMPAVGSGGDVITASIACFPFVSRGDGTSYQLEPDPDADLNILVMHASVKGHAEGGQLPYFYGSGPEALDIGRQAGRWDVIAVGDYHEFTLLHPDAHAFYSGSIERTSSNIWSETAPKGWVLVDTVAGALELQEIPTRRMADYDLGDFDLPPGAGAEDLNECLVKLASLDSLQGAIVRFKVDAFPREERDQVDWYVVREIKNWCAHFDLDLRFKKTEIAGLGDRREVHRAGIEEQAEAFFADDDQDVRDLAARYLEVSLHETADEDHIIDEAEAVPA